MMTYLREVRDSSPDCAGEAPAEYTFLLGMDSAFSENNKN